MNLTLACSDTSRTHGLLDGSLGIAGHHLTPATMAPEEMFRRAFETAEFDISELSFATFLLHTGRGTCPYVAIPVFPSRAFRHAAIYVRTGAGIAGPEDLRGRSIGVRSYLNTAALVARGLLADVYGIAASEIRWRIGDVDHIERDTIPIPNLFQNADIQAAPHGTTLTEMLASGAIDALIHYHPPRGFGDARSPIQRLFADPAAAERAYYLSSGIFPIMHLVGIRRTLHERDPQLARRVYDAFSQAKDTAIDYKAPQASAMHSASSTKGNGATTIDFTAPEYWPYGIASNRSAVDCLSRYAFEQGLTARQLTIDELFVAELLES